MQANRCPALRLSPNHGDFNLALWFSKRSISTRRPLNSSYRSYHSRDLCGRLHKTFNLKSGSRGSPWEPCRKPQKHISWACLRIPTYAHAWDMQLALELIVTPSSNVEMYTEESPSRKICCHQRTC